MRQNGRPNFNENDWRLFRQKVVAWQEAYINRLIEGYIQLLCENTTPSDKFWRLEQRISVDKKAPGVCLEMRRSMLFDNLIRLIDEDVISLADLSDFSDELKERMAFLFRNDSAVE